MITCSKCHKIKKGNKDRQQSLRSHIVKIGNIKYKVSQLRKDFYKSTDFIDAGFMGKGYIDECTKNFMALDHSLDMVVKMLNRE